MLRLPLVRSRELQYGGTWHVGDGPIQLSRLPSRRSDIWDPYEPRRMYSIRDPREACPAIAEGVRKRTVMLRRVEVYLFCDKFRTDTLQSDGHALRPIVAFAPLATAKSRRMLKTISTDSNRTRGIQADHFHIRYPRPAG